MGHSVLAHHQGGGIVTYELKVVTDAGQRIVAKMDGTDGEHAAERYADLHRGHTVYAYREPRHGLFVLGRGAVTS